MSGEPARLLATIPAWIRYGVIAGVFAFVCTLGANLAITWLQPAVTINIGVGLAAGAAALSGLLGLATRSQTQGASRT